MKQRVDLFIMIDACGWEIIKDRPQFLRTLAPHRRRLESVQSPPPPEVTSEVRGDNPNIGSDIENVAIPVANLAD